MRVARISICLLALPLALACGGGTEVDAGPTDAGPLADAGSDPDAGPFGGDAGADDAGDPDAGTSDSITLERDELGTPHIYAETMREAIYALGWASAEDRLFQMDFARRYAAGRMAEAFAVAGETELNDRLIAHDRYARMFGIERNAVRSYERLPGDVPELLQAYADGVNAYVAENGVPALFEQQSITWEPWRPEHSLMAWERVALTHQRPQMQKEIDTLLDCRGGCTVPTCELPTDPRGVSTPPPADGVWPPGGGGGAMSASYPRGADLFAEQSFYASHGWAVHGSRIDSGVSMLFGEPKLDVVAPPHWYQYHLVVADEDVDVRGAGFPGAPGMAMFWTRYTSQTITAGTGDLGDLFELTPGASADTYVVDGVEEAYTIHDETIRVRGGADVTMQVRESRFGPVVDDFVNGEPANRDYALRWAEHLEDDTHSVVAAIEMMRSDSLESYQAAIAHWVTPTANGIYAGRDRGDTSGPGNIAFHSLLSIPVRESVLIGGVDVTGRHPVDGSVAANDWDGVYELRWHPHVVDPPEGYIVNGNSSPTGDWIHDHLYTGLATSGDTYRGMQVRHRLEQLLPEASSVASGSAFDDVRLDAGMWSVELLGEILQTAEDRGLIAPPATSGAEPATDEERAAMVRRAIDLWVAGGAQWETGSALSLFVGRLTGAMVLASRSATALHCRFGHGNTAPPYILREVHHDPDQLDLDVVAFAIDAASTTWSGNATGPDPSTWADPEPTPYVVEVQNNWYCEHAVDPGNLGIGCSLTPEHEMSVVLLRAFTNTINSATSSSFPFTVDFSDIDASRALLPPGTNEDPTHPHFDSGLDLWQRLSTGQNTLPRAPLTRSEVTVESTTSLQY